MKLHTYFRSSASYRVRIALELKGLGYEAIPVHLVRNEHLAAAYASRMGDALVPALETDDGSWLSQSMAIIEYLDETHGGLRLLPGDALSRARVRALAQMVACEIHPLNNLRVLRYLVHELGVSEEDKSRWYAHWVRSGLEAMERQLDLFDQQRAASGLASSPFCWDETPTLADCCLVPQVFNARRFKVALDGLPRIKAIAERCEAMPAFARAHPSACPDAE
ncbi:maleylacetoacetate isomerase [Comamonas composti]|uniref:maleylacetoacetate isomerase n=1 Tax=Comamonas composti TaxID=408558 RepID=UPI0003F71890|nr:maleylacetoacetate isomerase [Comamonas composti]